LLLKSLLLPTKGPFSLSHLFSAPIARLYSPLARNLLATKLEAPPDDWRADLPRYSKENLEKNKALFDTVQALSTKYQCTPAQLSLAWLFHKANELGVTVIPIPGTTKLDNVANNVGSVTINVSDEDSAVLEGLAERVAGERGNEGYMSRSIESQK
jgi:aryl-alcohol dehydrogenase-like predicted oxidoreductase